MPLEGHWERQNTPLRGLSRRERRILAPFAIVLVLSLAALGLFLIFDNGSESSAGCVDVTGASTLGAATYHACGRSAARFCRSEADGNASFAADLRVQCRRAGYVD
jgi:hypothetical protein